MNTSLLNLLDRLNENMNTTSDGEVVNTPYAFSKKVQDPDDDAFSEDVPETDLFFKKMEESLLKIQKLTELNYKDYKSDGSRTERQKINSNILEINKKLREVEQMIGHASKLKLETGANQDVFWKGTLSSFLKIKERLNRLSNKIVEMSGG
jgi:hypothetical protein